MYAARGCHSNPPKHSPCLLTNCAAQLHSPHWSPLCGHSVGWQRRLLVLEVRRRLNPHHSRSSTCSSALTLCAVQLSLPLTLTLSSACFSLQRLLHSDAQGVCVCARARARSTLAFRRALLASIHSQCAQRHMRRCNSTHVCANMCSAGVHAHGGIPRGCDVRN